MNIVTVKLILETEGNAVQAVVELISEAFGKEETKENPRAKLILFEIVEPPTDYTLLPLLGKKK